MEPNTGTDPVAGTYQAPDLPLIEFGIKTAYTTYKYVGRGRVFYIAMGLPPMDERLEGIIPVSIQWSL